MSPWTNQITWREARLWLQGRMGEARLADLDRYIPPDTCLYDAQTMNDLHLAQGYSNRVKRLRPAWRKLSMLIELDDLTPLPPLTWQPTVGPGREGKSPFPASVEETIMHLLVIGLPELYVPLRWADVNQRGWGCLTTPIPHPAEAHYVKMLWDWLGQNPDPESPFIPVRPGSRVPATAALLRDVRCLVDYGRVHRTLD